jgi:hypothetical protein
MKKLITILFGTFFLVCSCSKPPQFSNVPEITFKQFSKPLVMQGSNPFTFTLTFKDGDGDLGRSENDTIFDIFFTDSRTNFLFKEKMPLINSSTRKTPVTGEIVVTVPAIFCTGVNMFDTLNYTVFIKDRANNTSNVLTTPDLYLKCF